jgi:immunity protein 5 of polymorphic toxin system
VILPKERDPRFITIRRGGTLEDSHHRLLAEWAAECAEHVLPLFETVQPMDPRPRRAVEQARAWTRGQITMTQARSAAGYANAAARELSGAARHAAHAAGQAAAVAHVAAHELGAAAYAIKAPSGSVNHAPRFGPICAIESVVLSGPSLDSWKRTPLALSSRTTATMSSTSKCANVCSVFVGGRLKIDSWLPLPAS